MNKALLRVLCLVLMVTSGLAFTLAFSSSTAGDVHAGPPQARPSQELTPTPEGEPVSHPGSTDGIFIMSVAIVVIILLPILLQRNTWKKQ